MRSLLSTALAGGVSLLVCALLTPQSVWAQPCELAFNHNSLPAGSLEVGTGPDESPSYIDQGIALAFDFYGPPNNLQYGYSGTEPDDSGFGFTQVLFLDDISAVYTLTGDVLEGTTVGQVSILFNDQSSSPEELSINGSNILAWNLPDFETYSGPTPWPDNIEVTVEMEPGSETIGHILITGPVNQVRIGGDRMYLDDFCVNPDNLPTDGGGCTYEVAINFDPEATVDDGTCVFVTCPDACDAHLDDDGVCDDVDPCVGTVDAIGICGGSCTADLDGDGDGDDEDCCVGSYDECGICNGPGAIYDCGCDVIPPGACDCGGNVLDALGECGGDCPADADGDGICDTVDDCVGTMDACGICNGPGAVYACGCFPLPEGDCDCEGNQIDALGICGGDCETDTDGDGICDTSEVPGCTDPTACNFNPEATDESGDCTYAEPGYTCAGDCIIDTDGDGICDDLEIGGCTDPEACNFNDDATDDSGCFYPAPGFNCAGECLEDADDDGVCDSLEILGCTEDEACNFNPDATEESGICLFPQPGFDCAGNCLEDADGDGICDGLELLGCLEDEACNFNPEAQQSDSSCVYPPFGYDCFGQCLNDSDGDGICDVFEVAGCMDVTACNFNPQATQPNDLCDYPPEGYTCDGNCLDFDGDGVCDVDEVLGCTYSNASNYDALATEENGTCEFPTGGGGGPGCPDLDGDGVVAINDLLNMLGAFGSSPDC